MCIVLQQGLLDITRDDREPEEENTIIVKMFLFFLAFGLFCGAQILIPVCYDVGYMS